MSAFRCKMCGGTLDIQSGSTVAVCEHCGTEQTVPRIDDEKRANLYDRANHFRRNNEFDKAMGIYEHILNEDSSDAEAYWSLVLCRYGIEYVEDPTTHKHVPTVHRTQYTSVFDDDNYRLALKNADTYQKLIYEEEAKAINEIQKGILDISNLEEPFDVFICYKETDANGERTRDSVKAQEIYYELTREGFKVFFSRITLEDKLGTAYEPYIFAALNSAKVMIAIGTKAEHFNSVWVKNEWSRYLSLIQSGGGNKLLIPAYLDMDPYDLPEEFSHLQAQDMSKLGFMQDLVRGIKKIVEYDKPQTTVIAEAAIGKGSPDTAPLLKRAFMFVEDGDWNSANVYCERVLDLAPECAEAYLGKLLTELKLRSRTDLPKVAHPFDHFDNYKKILRFGDKALIDEIKGANTIIRARNEEERKNGIYQKAVKLSLNNTPTSTTEAAQLFASIPDYRDANERSQQCTSKAKQLREKAAELQAAESKRLAEERAADEKIREEIQRQRAEEIAKEKRRTATKRCILLPPACIIIVVLVVKTCIYLIGWGTDESPFWYSWVTIAVAILITAIAFRLADASEAGYVLMCLEAVSAILSSAVTAIIIDNSISLVPDSLWHFIGFILQWIIYLLLNSFLLALWFCIPIIASGFIGILILKIPTKS